MCDLACRTKIILNGARIQSTLNDLCYQIKENPLDETANGEKMIEILNRMEEDGDRVVRLYLEGLGFKGPFPKAMKE